VLLTFIGIVRHPSFKLLLLPIPIVKYGSRATMKRRMASKVSELLNVSLWVNIGL
jgi:hypothetical protein